MPVVTWHPHDFKVFSSYYHINDLTKSGRAALTIVDRDFHSTFNHDDIIYLAPQMPMPSSHDARTAQGQAGLYYIFVQQKMFPVTTQYLRKESPIVTMLLKSTDNESFKLICSLFRHLKILLNMPFADHIVFERFLPTSDFSHTKKS